MHRSVFARLLLIVFVSILGSFVSAENRSQDPSLGGLRLSSSTSSTPAADPTFGTSISSSASLPGMGAAEADDTTPKAGKAVKIEVKGNKHVRERVILAQVKTRKNDMVDSSSLRRDVQNIYALGNFEDVNVEVDDAPGGVVVRYLVVEKPKIKHIDFKGNKKLGNGKLREAISLKESEPFDKLKLSLDVSKIADLYRDEGYASAHIEEVVTNDTANNTTSITFNINEGKRVLIDQVKLEGVSAFPVKKVLKQMKTRRKKVFKQDVLDKDLESVRRYYSMRGYQNVHLGEVTQTFNEDRTKLTLTLPIEEGPQLSFSSTTFSGNLIHSSEKLAGALQYKPGEIFNQQKLDVTMSKLQDLYGELGYIRVQIKPQFNQDLVNKQVGINFAIEEGDVVYVDHIGIEGNTRTKDYVIRREVKLKEGDPFSSVKARKSVERLYNLGFLDNVDIDVQQPNEPDKADVIFTVTEGKPGVLSAGAGYSSVDGLIGTMQVQHINFLGRGQRVNFMWEFGSRRNSFDIGWTEPWFMNRPLSLGLDIFNVRRQVALGSNRDAYQIRDRGGSVTVGPRFSDVYSLLFTYLYADRLRSDVADEFRPQVLGPDRAANPLIKERKLTSSNITVQGIRDSRDNQFDPTRGQRTSLSVTTGGLFPSNAIKFYKPFLDDSIHFPTFWKFVLSFHAALGYVKPFQNSSRDEIVDELFKVGGSDTVRGYDLGRIGPPDGGQVMNVYNVEYKFPIAPDESGKTLLQGVLFYDIGGAWNDISEISYQVDRRPFTLKHSVGFGIRFKTPVFPLRLDWGHALNPPAGEAESQFHFSVGSLF